MSTIKRNMLDSTQRRNLIGLGVVIVITLLIAFIIYRQSRGF